VGRLSNILEANRDAGCGSLIPFVVAGDPSLDATGHAILAMANAGADVIEIGIPFSDPIADGPVIAAAMHRALAHGTTAASVLAMVASIRPKCPAALVAMVSNSIVRRLGSSAFVDQLANAGFDGLIVPDIDDAEISDLAAACSERDMSFTMLVAPTTTPQRLAMLADQSSGFLYLLARVGLTGETSGAPDVAGRVEEARAITDLPLAVGFGISSAQHVAAVTACADAAVVGSALVRRMAESDDPAVVAGEFIAQLAAPIRA